MNTFKFAAVICVLVGSLIPLVSSAVIPGASTPLFYLVSSSTESSPNPSVNMMPLRLTGSASAIGYSASTLSGSWPIGQFYFYQGNFVALDSTHSSTDRGMIARSPEFSGCTADGPLGFTRNTTVKCDEFTTFALQSDTENSQLGAMLTFNSVGGFYACGSTQDVWYKVNSQDAPAGCFPIDLYTVPVF